MSYITKSTLRALQEKCESDHSTKERRLFLAGPHSREKHLLATSCLSVCPRVSEREIWYWRLLWTSVQNFQIWLQSCKNIGRYKISKESFSSHQYNDVIPKHTKQTPGNHGQQNIMSVPFTVVFSTIKFWTRCIYVTSSFVFEIKS